MRKFAIGLLATLALTLPAAAQVKVGIIVSATGPAASVGITQQRTVPILPKSLGGQDVEYVLLDDASDTSTSVKHGQKHITEDRVDVILGPSLTPNSLALLDMVTENGVPLISLAGSALIVEPMDEKRHWVFKTPQSDRQMASVVIEHLKKTGVKSIAFIGFADAYGEGWIKVMTALVQEAGIEVTASERYQRTDSSVTGQVLKIVSGRPDAVFIAASGTPAALPQTTLIERGFTGAIYQTHGVANNDFLRVGGKALEGTFVPAGPVLVAEQLPDDHPAKKPAMDFIEKYEALPGAGARSTFAAYLWDAQLILDVAIKKASQSAKPGTAEFRSALRDAIEQTKDVAASNGVFNMSPSDHLGLDERSRVLTRIVDGKWVLVQ